MSAGRLEHVNISVTDPDRSAELLKQLCGWEERWRGSSQMGGRSVHVGEQGNGSAYVALYTGEHVTGGYGKGAPLNHVGLCVDDLDAAERIVVAAGLEPFSHDDYEPGRRFYFFDWDGIEFEVVSYIGGEP